MHPATPDAGVVVISQVRRQQGQGDGPEEGQPYNVPGSLPKPVLAFYTGEPEALGSMQVFAGILAMSIGLIATISEQHTYSVMALIVYSGVTFWSGVLCIVSGSLSVAASVKPSVGKVKAGLVMNIFSAAATLCGIIFAVFQLASDAHYYRTEFSGSYCAYQMGSGQCLGSFTPLPVIRGILAFILMLFMLMFCVAISTSVFACRTVCRSSFDEMNVVIYQTTSLNVSDATRDVPMTLRQP